MKRTTLVVFSLLVLCLRFHDATSSSTIYGVNLGGWLVLEGFIKPSLYRSTNDTKVADTWTFCEAAKRDPANAVTLRNHWDTWVTETDIQELSQVGITHLRIPVGYWMMMSQEELDENNEPFLVDTWKYFVNAVRWAKKHNLQIVVDLHAAPGSQNGWEHSGRTGEVLWGTGTTIERTLTVIERLAREIKSFEDDPELKGTVIGIDVLNEPTPWSVPGGIATIKSYYEKAYDRIRQHLPKVYVVLSEGFSEPSVWNDFMLPPNYTNVVFDLHTYHCFDEYLRKASYEVHLNVSCFIFANKVTNHVHPTWTGEWSLAYKLPPEWSENEPYPTSMEQKLWLRRFGMAQRRSYSMPRGLGWFFWNFKTENSVMWDYLKGVHGKWLPCSFPATDDPIVCSNVENPNIVQDLYNCQ